MITLSRFLLSAQRFMKPADDGTDGTAGGTVDRGDSWTPTAEEDAEALKLKLEGDEAKKAAAMLKAKDDLKKEPEKKEPEAKADPDEDIDPEDPDKKGGKDTRIPASRHKAILQAERELRANTERELAKYRQGAAVAETNKEITELETKLAAADTEQAKLLTDGEHEKAAAKAREIRTLEREISGKNLAVQVAAAEARAVEKVRYDTTVERMEEAYPQLNPDHDDFDKVQTGEVLEMKEAFQMKGYTQTHALQKAIKYVMGAPKTAAEKKAVEVTPQVSAEDAAKARAAAQREKNLKADKATPPSSAKIGADSDKLGGGITAKDVLKMSQEDFAKLDDKALAAMRGDEVEA